MAYTGSSIIDYLKSVGKPSDFTSRAKLATQYRIANYLGTAEQNLKLLGLLRGETKTTSTDEEFAKFAEAALKGGSMEVTPLTVATSAEGKIVPTETVTPEAEKPITISPTTGQVVTDEAFSKFAEEALKTSLQPGFVRIGGDIVAQSDLDMARSRGWASPTVNLYDAAGKVIGTTKLELANGQYVKTGTPLTIKEEDGKLVDINTGQQIGEIDPDTGDYIPHLTEDDILRIVRGEIPANLTAQDILKLLEGKLPVGLTKEDVRALMGEIPEGLTEEDIKRIIGEAQTIGLTKEEVQKWIVDAAPSMPIYPTKEEIQGWIGEAMPEVGPEEGAVRINPATGEREVYRPWGEWEALPEKPAINEEQIKSWMTDLVSQGLSGDEIKEWISSAIGTIPAGITEEDIKRIVEEAIPKAPDDPYAAIKKKNGRNQDSFGRIKGKSWRDTRTRRV